MSRFKLTRTQCAVLAALVLLNLVIIVGLGVVLLRTPSALPEALTVLPSEGRATATRPAPPPTWTPPPTSTPVGFDLLYTFTPGPCPFEIPAGAVVECGTVGVPERRDTGSPNVVRLAVARYRSHREDPEAEPLIFLTGGPGGGAVRELARAYDTFIFPLLAERDVVVFDQRGTGLSAPNLDCPDFHAAFVRDLEWNYTAEEQAAAYLTALGRCRTRWASRDVDVAAYTSAANATDVRDLLAVLGYEQAILYGASYGSRLALTVMRDHPEVVHSAVLDGVVPVEVPLFNEQGARVDRILNQLFAGCAADSACRASYPELRATYEEARQRLDADPVTVWTKKIGQKSYRVRVDGSWLTGALFFGAYETEVVRYLPLMIDDVARGEYELLAWMLGSVGERTDLSLGMYLSVNCHEEVFATSPEELREDLALYGHVEGFAHWSTYGMPETLFALCERWEAAPFDPVEGERVVSDIPTLLLSGEYDPITPPEYGRQVADALGNARHYVFPGQGHVLGIWQSPCAVRITRDFISDPHAELDTACVDALSGPDFLTR